MPAERLLLDTHALLWWQAGSARLTERATNAVNDAQQVWISAISLWDLATLVRLGHVALDRSPRQWATDLLSGAVECLDVEPVVATGAG